MGENEKKLIRQMLLGSALNSIENSGSAILTGNKINKSGSQYNLTDITREVREIERYISNYEKYRPYLSIIEDYIQKHEKGEKEHD